MAKYKGYEKYKDSGIGWIGEVPEHWNKSKMSWCFNTIGSGGTPSSTNQEYYEGDINWLITGDLNDGIINSTSKKINELALMECSTLKIYPKGSLIVAMYGATIGKLGITEIETTTNQACCVLSSPIDVNIRYMFYWFLGNKSEIVNLSQGGGQPNISQGLVKGLKLYKPSLEEQIKIADFLNQKTSEIDSLVTDKEKLLNLLEEKRQAIVAEAITKGLNTNVETKYSGVELIGEIPQHWKVNRLKNIANIKVSNVDKKTVEGQESVLLCNYTDVYYNNKITSQMNFMKATAKQEQIESFSLKKDDVLITKDSETSIDIARVSWVEEDIKGVLCGYHLAQIRPGDVMNGRYIFYLHESNKIREQYCSNANGVTRFGISKGVIKNALVLVPPKQEQKEIADFLDEKTRQIDNVKLNIKLQIEKLIEYRKSLISEAVIGKIDVRDYYKEA